MCYKNYRTRERFNTCAETCARVLYTCHRRLSTAFRPVQFVKDRPLFILFSLLFFYQLILSICRDPLLILIVPLFSNSGRTTSTDRHNTKQRERQWRFRRGTSAPRHRPFSDFLLVPNCFPYQYFFFFFFIHLTNRRPLLTRRK